MVYSLDLFDVEPDEADGKGTEKIIELVRIVEGCLGQDRDDMVRDAVPREGERAREALLVGAAPRPRATMGVVKERGPVEADSDAERPAAEELAPGFRNEHRVRLHVVRDAGRAWYRVVHSRHELLERREPDGQRLPRVPHDGKVRPNEPSLDQALRGRARNLGAHLGPHRPLRQIAVVAVDVTERRRLKN